MLTRYKIIWMVGILITGMIGLVFSDQAEFLGILQRNGGFTIKPQDIKQVGRELRASVPADKQVGTTVPLRTSNSKDPRAKIIQESLNNEDNIE
jgi:hypothetical protein